MSSNAVRAETLVRALVASVEGDRDTVGKLFTDDVQAWTPARSASSLSELLANFQERDEAFSDWALEATPLDVGGDHACVEWTVEMTHSGSIALRDGVELEPTGLRVTLNGVAVAEFDGDRICALRQHWDELSLMEQLGLL
jgi:ketosteroid isomerase-like protein